MFSQIVYSVGMLLLALSKNKVMAAFTSITGNINKLKFIDFKIILLKKKPE